MKVFTHAIEHPVPRKSSDQVEVVDIAECHLCEENDSMIGNLSKQILALAKASSKLAESKGADVDDVSLSDEDETFHAIHIDDWKAFKRFTSTFRRKPTKSEPRELREEVLRCLKPHEALLHVAGDESDETKSLSEIDRRTLELVGKLVRPLKCSKHHLPTLNGLTIPHGGPKPKISAQVLLLSNTSYRKYILSLGALARILILSEDSCDFEVVDDSGELIDLGITDLFTKQGVFDWHPRLAYSLHCRSERSVVMEWDACSAPMVIHSDFCREKECYEELEKLFPREPKQNGETPTKYAGNAADPITIDVDPTDSSPTRDTFPLTVFEADTSASEESIMDALTQYSNVSNGTEKEGTGNGLRRSSRRRKTRIPTGVLKSEDTVRVDICNNIAALRLLLYEGCQEGTAFSPDHRLILVVSPVDTRAEPDGKGAKQSIAVPLDFSFNQKTLIEVCDETLGSLSELVPKDSLVLVRQSIVLEDAMDLGKDDLITELINLSNVSSPDSNGKKRKARVVEKGFTGTLLSAGQGNTKKTRSEDGKEEDKPAESGFTGSMLSTASPKVSESNSKQEKEETPISLLSADPSKCRALVLVDDNQGSVKREERSPTKAKVLQNGRAMNRAAMSNDSDAVVIQDDTQEEEEGTRVIMSIMDRLNANPLVDPLKSQAVFKASKWVVEERSGLRDEESLADRAYAKYLDLTLE